MDYHIKELPDLTSKRLPITKAEIGELFTIKYKRCGVWWDGSRIKDYAELPNTSNRSHIMRNRGYKPLRFIVLSVYDDYVEGEWV